MPQLANEHDDLTPEPCPKNAALLPLMPTCGSRGTSSPEKLQTARIPNNKPGTHGWVFRLLSPVLHSTRESCSGRFGLKSSSSQGLAQEGDGVEIFQVFLSF